MALPRVRFSARRRTSSQERFEEARRERRQNELYMKNLLNEIKTDLDSSKIDKQNSDLPLIELDLNHV